MKQMRLLVTGLSLVALIVTGCGLNPAGRVDAGAQRAAVSVKARNVPASYYAPAQGKQGQALLQALRGVVAEHTDLGYNQARDVMFADADDLDNNNVVECVYIGRTLPNITNRGTAFHNGRGFNAEHTWPQSKGAVGAAKADLHHLFASDCNANSTRGSFPFGEVEHEDWSQGGSQRGTDAQGNTVFEPRAEHKGNVARALLYFYTVYGHLGSTDLVNFRLEEETLKAWHQADPVTAEDRQRNDIVFKAQGNRNPFVDHPEFVQAIGKFQDAQRARR
ncbi:MAG: endonuclease I family protein [Candidatus Sericytochromatia bacterium]